MVDIHCHILPAVDDGPADFQAFFEMVNSAIDAGITHLFATPHHLNGRYVNERDKIMERINEANRLICQENLPLVIHPGQEIRINREIFSSIENGEILTYDNKGKYLLLELPSREIPQYTNDVIYELLLKGITPILAHPERNRAMLEDQHLLFELVHEGALVQITAGSILGHFGRKIKNFTGKIIEHQLIHFIASDAHNTEQRGFVLEKAYESITNKYGPLLTEYLQKNAQSLLHEESIDVEQPRLMRKKLLGFF